MNRRSSAKKAEPARQPTGFKKVRRTEEFLEEVKPDSPQPNVISIPAVEVEEEEPDRFEQFFEQVRDQQGWTLLIFRLNSYHKDGKASMRNDKSYLGRITFDPDTYLDDIQAMCPEGGAFKLQAKTPDNRYSEQWVEQIMPLKGKAAQTANTHYFIQPPAGEEKAPEPPRDTLQELLDAGEKAAKLKKIFGWDNEQQQVAVTPATATVEREPLQDRIIEAALNAALKTEKPENIAGLLQSYLNPKSDEFSWKEIIGEVVKPMLPMFMGLIAAYAQRQQGAQPNVSTQNGQPPQLVNGTFIIREVATGNMAEVPNGSPIPEGWIVMQATIPQPSVVSAQPTFGFAPMPAMELPQNGPNVTMQPQLIVDEPLSQEEEASMAIDDVLLDLADMLDECVRRAASDPNVIAKGRTEVIKFRTAFPIMSDLIDGMVGWPPEVLIGALAVKAPHIASLINNEVAKQAIRDFQASLRQPVENES